jgi:hypothetical protein
LRVTLLRSYEKSNIQEQIMRNGEYEFLQRQNEVSALLIARAAPFFANAPHANRF